MSDASWTLAVDLDDRAGTLDVELATRDGGAGSPVLLCLHGFGDNLQTWQRLRSLAEPRGARVVAVDLPGFGRSPLPPRFAARYTRNAIALARAMTAALRAEGVPLVLVGNSLGGAIALGCAAADPRAADALLLLSPATPDTRTPIFVHLLHAPVYRWTEAIKRRLPPRARRAMAVIAARACLRTVLPPGVRPPPDWWESMVQSFLRPGAFEDVEHVARDVLWMLRGEPSPSRELLRGVERVSAPIAIVRGDLDRVIGARETAALARRLPSARLVTLPGVGHCPQVEAPERCLEVLLDLVARAGAARGSAGGGPGAP